MNKFSEAQTEVMETIFNLEQIISLSEMSTNDIASVVESAVESGFENIQIARTMVLAGVEIAKRRREYATAK